MSPQLKDELRQILIKVRKLEEHVDSLSAVLRFALRSVGEISSDLQALMPRSFLPSPSTPSEPNKRHKMWPR